MKKENAGFYQIAFAATAFFFIAFWIHYPGLMPNTYSDLVDTIWTDRVPRSGGMVPYVDYNLEYPALSGIVVYVSSIFNDMHLYYSILSLVSYGCMLTSLYIVYRMLGPSGQWDRKITYFIVFTPTFLYFSTYSFDWLGVALLLLSIWYADKKKPSLSGLFMGLSVAARIIPIVCLPFILREFSTSKKKVVVLVAAASAWLACNIYFIVANFSGFLYPYLYQATYFADEDSWLNMFPLGLSKSISITLLICALGFILVWKRRRFNLFEASFLALLGFVLVSYKFPPQYMILLLPLFALNRTNYILFTAANLLNVMIILWWFTPSFNFGNPMLVTSPVQWLAIARQVILLPIFINFFRSNYRQRACTSATSPI